MRISNNGHSAINPRSAIRNPQSAVRVMVSKLHVEATINGEAVEFLCEAGDSLLAALRNTVGLTGTKEGCTTGDCGACSVIMNGRLVPACLVLAPEADGQAITTIEGIADGERLHPLQQKFLDHAALQCGICTPGFIVAAKALLDAKPDPTEEETRYWLAGNLCRCTGYDKIIRAVLDAAAQLSTLKSQVSTR
jgi:aerobic carbon-monoxide dehydrogenase small subunit